MLLEGRRVQSSYSRNHKPSTREQRAHQVCPLSDGQALLTRLTRLLAFNMQVIVSGRSDL